MQLAIHLPLFSDQFPGYAFILYSLLINIASLEAVDIEGDLAEIFNLDADEGSYSLRFERMQYGSKNFIMNTGSFLLFLVFTIFLMLFTAFLKICENKSTKIKKLRKRLIEDLYWNTFLRIIKELVLEFYLIAMIDTTVANFSTAGYRFSFSLAIMSIFSILCYAAVLRFHLKPKYHLLK